MTAGTRGVRRGALAAATLLAAAVLLAAGPARADRQPSPGPGGGAATDGGGGSAGTDSAGGSAGSDGSALGLRRQQVSSTLGSAAEALETATTQTNVAYAAYVTADASLPAARATLAGAQGRLDGAQARAAQATRELASARARLIAARAAIAAAQQLVAMRRDQVSRFARAAYEGGPAPVVRAFVAASSPQELADRDELLRYAGRSARVQILALDAATADLGTQVASADREARTVGEQQAAVLQAVTEAAAATTDARRAAGALEALAQRRQAAFASARHQQSADAARYGQLQAESDRIGALILAEQQRAAAARAAAAAAAAELARRQAAQEEAAAAAVAARDAATRPSTATAGATGGGAPVAAAAPATAAAATASTTGEALATAPAELATPGRGGLIWPTPGPLTSGFGYRVDPVTGKRQLHAGIDIGAPIGQPIVAAAAGTVVYAGEETGYGNYTCIDHGGGLATCYAHQSAILVTVGQVVAQGEAIGRVGSTGYSTGPHLHFETRVDGTPVDPQQYY